MKEYGRTTLELMEISCNDLVLILKNAGNACNIGCVYCAEARKKSLNLSKLRKVTLEDVNKLIYLTRDVENLTVLFHGGEPLLLGIDYYEKIITLWRTARKDVYFGFQTNGTLINSAWLDFFDRHRDVVGISISLDGDPIANSYRQNKDGSESYPDVIKALNLLEKNNLSTGLISTLTQASIGREQELFDIITAFSNIRFVKLNPCFDLFKDSSVPRWAILPENYSTFVLNFFDIMYREKYFSTLNVEPILSIIKGLEGIENSFCNYCNKKCTHFLSVYPNGKLIPCDNFDLTDGMYPDFRDKDRIEDVLSNQPQPLCSELDDLMLSCKGCLYNSICYGGCLAVRRRYKKYGRNNEYASYCKEMKRMIDYIRKKIESVRTGC